jgi:hypothetical protein
MQTVKRAVSGSRMSTQPEMSARARAEALGVVFAPVVQLPVNRSILRPS